MKMEGLKRRLKDPKWLTACGVIGIGLLILPSISPQTVSRESVQDSVQDAKTIQSEIEQRLADAVERIDGAGKAFVLVSLSDTGTESFLLETDTDESSESRRVSENAVIASGSAVHVASSPPKVSGVAIVCEGGGDPKVEEKIDALIRALYGLSSTRISVSEGNRNP